MDNNNPYVAPVITQQQPNTPQEPANPQQPAPATPAQPAAATNNEDVLTLEDLFPTQQPAAAPAQPTQQPAPAAATPAAPAQGDDDTAKLRDEFNQQFQQSNEQLTQNLKLIDQKVERTTELNTFFSKPDNAPFAKYQNEITKVATDPRFIGMKLDRVLPFALGMQTMMKIGAEMSTEAGQRANQNRTGGAQNMQRVQQQTQGKDYAAMSNAEFDAYTAAIQRGERPN